MAIYFNKGVWENYPDENTILNKDTLNKLNEDKKFWKPLCKIQMEPIEYKCKSCGAPLKRGQTKCEWCRTVYSW